MLIFLLIFVGAGDGLPALTVPSDVVAVVAGTTAMTVSSQQLPSTSTSVYLNISLSGTPTRDVIIVNPNPVPISSTQFSTTFSLQFGSSAGLLTLSFNLVGIQASGYQLPTPITLNVRNRTISLNFPSQLAINRDSQSTMMYAVDIPMNSLGVRVAVDRSTEMSISPSYFVFSAVNAAYGLVLRAQNAGIYTLSFTLDGPDVGLYDSIPSMKISVIAAKIVSIAKVSSIALGRSVQLSVSLSAPPTSDVQIHAATTAVTFSPNPLVFTVSNDNLVWTMAAAQTGSYAISYGFSGSSANEYAYIPSSNIQIISPKTISVSFGLLQRDFSSSPCTISISSLPSSSLVVSLSAFSSSSSINVASFSPSSLTFLSSSSSSLSQTFIVTPHVSGFFTVSMALAGDSSLEYTIPGNTNANVEGPCPVGTYSSNGRSPCISCYIGSYIDVEGSTTCTPCPSGTSTATNGSKSLSDCSMTCLPGYFSSSGVGVCQSCDFGTFSIGGGAKLCTQCPPGMDTLQQASTSIQDCLPYCSVGQYGPIRGVEPCLKCAQGYYNSNVKASACTNCPAYTSTATMGSTSFFDCTTQCNPGFLSPTGVLPCKSCLQGSFSSSFGSTACSSCPNGMTSPAAASTSVLCSNLCQPGTSSMNGVVPCDLCPFGSYSSSIGATVCTDCPTGNLTIAKGCTSIRDCKKLCDRGQYSQDGTVPCSPCPLGTFSSIFGSTTCTSCPLYMSTASTGTIYGSDCSTQCNPGTFSSNGLAPCTDCSAGHYSKVVGATVCLACDSRGYAPSARATACTACPSGSGASFLASTSISNCVADCDIGTYGNFGVRPCVLCPNGTFAALSSQSQCTVCPLGTTTLQLGTNSSTQCVYLGQALSELAVKWVAVKNHVPWTSRWSPGSISLNDTVYLLGGNIANGGFSNDVWTTNDGSNWTLATDTAQWPSRTSHGAAAISSTRTLMIAGGTGFADGLMNDVWISTQNGNSWILATQSASWTPRFDCGMVEMGNQIWVMGGGTGNNGYLNDVWYTTSGDVWAVSTRESSWDARAAFAATHLADSILLMGGVNDGSMYNDVWSSSDGIKWTLMTLSAPWSSRHHHSTVTISDKVVIFCGRDSKQLNNDVWFTKDGVTWALAVSRAAALPPRSHLFAANLHNQFLVVGAGDLTAATAAVRGDGSDDLYVSDLTYPGLLPPPTPPPLIADMQLLDDFVDSLAFTCQAVLAASFLAGCTVRVVQASGSFTLDSKISSGILGQGSTWFALLFQLQFVSNLRYLGGSPSIPFVDKVTLQDWVREHYAAKFDWANLIFDPLWLQALFNIQDVDPSSLVRTVTGEAAECVSQRGFGLGQNREFVVNLVFVIVSAICLFVLRAFAALVTKYRRIRRASDYIEKAIEIDVQKTTMQPEPWLFPRNEFVLLRAVFMGVSRTCGRVIVSHCIVFIANGALVMILFPVLSWIVISISVHVAVSVLLIASFDFLPRTNYCYWFYPMGQWIDNRRPNFPRTFHRLLPIFDNYTHRSYFYGCFEMAMQMYVGMLLGIAQTAYQVWFIAGIYVIDSGVVVFVRPYRNNGQNFFSAIVSLQRALCALFIAIAAAPGDFSAFTSSDVVFVLSLSALLLELLLQFLSIVKTVYLIITWHPREQAKRTFYRVNEEGKVEQIDEEQFHAKKEDLEDVSASVEFVRRKSTFHTAASKPVVDDMYDGVDKFKDPNIYSEIGSRPSRIVAARLMDPALFTPPTSEKKSIITTVPSTRPLLVPPHVISAISSPKLVAEASPESPMPPPRRLFPSDNHSPMRDIMYGWDPPEGSYEWSYGIAFPSAAEIVSRRG